MVTIPMLIAGVLAAIALGALLLSMLWFLGTVSFQREGVNYNNPVTWINLSAILFIIAVSVIYISRMGVQDNHRTVEHVSHSIKPHKSPIHLDWY